MSVTTFAAAQLLRLMPRSRISRAVGWLCEHPLPPKVSHAIANAYIRAYGVDMTEVTPNGPYASFDAFFTQILVHELMHGLGPHNITVNGRQTAVRQELRKPTARSKKPKPTSPRSLPFST